MKKKKKRVSINKKVFPFMKRGFTLVELLAVLVILAVLVALSVPTYYVVSNQIKESSYETKLENIISHAESYAENTNNFVFDVGTLIEQGLLEADNEAGEYLDPRNGRDMRCDIINVVFENNQYVASVTESDTCYTDEELQNLFGMFEIVIYRPDGTKEHGSEYGTMPTPTRSNHRFLGWFTSATGGTQITSTSIVTGNITLYAHWEVIGHTVTYDYSYNGGTSASKTSELVATGSKVDLSPTASKSGYSFVGWNTNANATSGLSNITMGNSDIRLYAIYRKTVTVTLVDFNGSSRRTRTVSGTAYNRNTSTSITIPALGSYTGTCNGDWVSSLGWSTSTAASATVNYNGNTTYTLSSNLTLYARYQHQAIIWLDPGDGTTTSQHSATSTNQINAGNNSNGAPNMSNPGPYSYYVFDMNPTRTGHSSNKFGGWYLSQCMGDDNVSGYSRCFNNVGSLPTSEDNARKTAFTFYYKCGGFLAIRWDR